jgi:hypothetical protein
MAFGIRGLVLGQQLIIVILKNMGWRNIAKHQTRHGKQKKQKTTQKNIIHKQCKRRGKPAGKKKNKTQKKKQKKTRKRNTKKTGKKHETIKIHNPGLWLVKNIINLRTYSGTCDVLVF